MNSHMKQQFMIITFKLLNIVHINDSLTYSEIILSHADRNRAISIMNVVTSS